MLNTPEIIVIGGIALIMFGSKKLPELARSLGQGIREFKKASSETTEQIRAELEAAHASPPHSDHDAYHDPHHPAPAQISEHSAEPMADHLPPPETPKQAPVDPAKV